MNALGAVAQALPNKEIDTAPVIVSLASDADRIAIDAYIDQHPQGTIFHRAGWGEAAHAAYGCQDKTLVAKNGERIVGVLPLTLVAAPVTGRALISTAYSVGGGPIGDSAGIVQALAAGAERIGAEHRVRYIELRDDPELDDERWRGKSGLYARFELPLSPNSDEMLARLPRKRRAEIRKAIKAQEAGDLRLRIVDSVDDFYALYAEALRNHGTPIFPRKFIETLMRAFSQQAEISVAEWRGAPVAALVSFYDGETVRPYYIGALREAREARAAEFLYWSLMHRAGARGCTCFDFGRSKIGAGPYHFKKLWGAAEYALTYRVAFREGGTLPSANPTSAGYAQLVSLWRRLPRALTDRIGPLVAKNFP